jgi:hypothetical protein
MAFTEVLSVFLADFGVSVSFSGSAAGMLGIEDAQGLLALSSEQFPGVQATDRTVLIRTDQKGALKPDTAITVNGTARTVRYLLPYEDGAFTLVWVK